MSTCIYCGGRNVGSSCNNSPTKRCVIHTPDKCIYCGGRNVGSSCNNSPTGKCSDDS